MKKHNIILCMLMCLCCVACEDKKKTPEHPPSEISIEGYRPADIELSGDFDEVISLDRSYDDVYIFGRTKTGGYSGYLTDRSFSEYERMNFVPQTDETVISSAFLPFGKRAVLTYLDGKTMIYIYGKDGIQEKALDCGEILESPDTPAEIFPLGRNQYIVNVNNQRLVQLQNDGSYVWDVEVDGNILNVFRGTDNTVICFYDNGNAKFTASVDPQRAILTDMKKTDISEVYASCMGEKYYICVCKDGIYGLSGSKAEKITDFTNMDFKPSDVRYIVEIAGGYAVTLNDGSMKFITEENITELKAKKLIQVGVAYNTTNIYNMIKTYNENNSGSDYKVEMKIYDSYWDNGEKYREDFLSGNAPDILEMDNINIDTFGNYEHFADLYPLIDNDPDLNREDFMPNILSGFERDGKLLQLGNQFRIETFMADKDSGIPENWTVDDMTEVYNNLPESKSLFNFVSNRESYFSSMLDESIYIDYGKKECYFDSPEFIKYMKFFQENEIGLTFDEYVEWNENVIKPFKEQTDGAIGEFTNICTPEDIYYNSRSDFNIWAGFVGNGSTGGSTINVDNIYAINADSPYIDASWDFMRTMYTGKKDNNITVYYFPVKIKDFEEQLKVFTRDNAYVDSKTGKTVIEKRRDSQGNELENFTPEEYEYYRDKVMSIRVNHVDNTISNIVNETSFGYFAGNTTAEKTAETIQKKVTEYLNS